MHGITQHQGTEKVFSNINNYTRTFLVTVRNWRPDKPNQIWKTRQVKGGRCFRYIFYLPRPRIIYISRRGIPTSLTTADVLLLFLPRYYVFCCGCYACVVLYGALFDFSSVPVMHFKKLAFELVGPIVFLPRSSFASQFAFVPSTYTSRRGMTNNWNTFYV